MNPMLMLFAFLGTVSGLAGLGGGRGRSTDVGSKGKGKDDGDPPQDPSAGPVDDGATSGGSEADPDGSGGTNSPGSDGNTDGPDSGGGGGSGSGSGNELPDTSQPAVDGMSVAAGRVTTIDTGLQDVASIRIIDKPAIGNLTVNPDNKLALVLTGTDYDGPLSFRYEATLSDGSTQISKLDLNVQPLQQLQGWATGENVYMLETDAEGRLVVEHGDNHFKIHVSGSSSALSRADIARLEGVSESDVTSKFLIANGYGTTPATAVDAEVGKMIWNGATIWNSEPGSHWLLFEKGYEYHFGNVIAPGTTGESELHPYYVGTYGNGAAPVITGPQGLSGAPSSNFVVDGLEFTDDVRYLESSNIIMNDVILNGAKITVMSTSGEINGFTLRDSTIYDVVQDAPKGNVWGTIDRVSGLFVRNVNGLLVEGTHIDHVGWEEGYSWDGDPNFGQTPNKMSQNVYIQHGVDDITFRDNISMRAASFGAQIRPGGFIEDNVFLDNNGAVNALGGKTVSEGVEDGSFTFMSDNLITSGGGRDSYIEGALTWGIDGHGYGAAYLDNIVAHLADPNNPIEFATKLGNGSALPSRDNPYFEDTIVYNWIASNFNATRLANNADRNVDGLDTRLLDKTTIQNFTAALLGKPSATIDDLGQFLRGQVADGQVNQVEADDIIGYFQKAFGIAPAVRTEAETLRFVPSDLADGVRWDNRINWTTEDLPGTVAGDSVDLGGNWVNFATISSRIDDLHFGSEGKLTVTSGRLDVTGDTTAGTGGAEIDISKAGQLWIDGYSDSDRLDIDVLGGRFANTGVFRGDAHLTASGGQTLLGVDGSVYAVTDGSRLEVSGGEGKIGFDGAKGGISILGLADGGTLAFKSEDGTLGTIEEFRSGALGDSVNVRSGADLGGGRLEIDLSQLAGGSEFTLLDVDELIGAFKSVNVTGLSGQNAELIIDYQADEVRLKLAAGSGSVKTTLIGQESAVTAGEEALMKALTAGQGTYDDADPLTDDEDYPFAA